LQEFLQKKYPEFGCNPNILWNFEIESTLVKEQIYSIKARIILRLPNDIEKKTNWSKNYTGNKKESLKECKKEASQIAYILLQ
jgi:hypothetical protein